MKEIGGHIFHKKRKWRCPKCGRVKMQKPRPA
jgi:DNA-directed RNA polymerase subunit RPC12/RpoP